MAGFTPVGSSPVASSGPALVGTYMLPAPAVIILEGVTVQANVSGLKSSQLSRETLLATAAQIRSSGLSRETLLATAAQIRSSALYREVLMAGVSNTGDNCSVCIVWGD